MFELKPFFRESTIKYNDINMLDPFKDIGSKIIYFFGYLLLPILFIPLLFPKNGILAGPAIGINLISGYNPMYSSHYHYDDVSSTLLLIATIVSLGSIKFLKFELWIKQKKTLQIFLVIWFMFFLVLLPYSSLRFIKKSLLKSGKLMSTPQVGRLRCRMFWDRIFTERKSRFFIPELIAQRETNSIKGFCRMACLIINSLCWPLMCLIGALMTWKSA